MIGYDDPRHGTDRGYSAGCRQACCRAAHTAAHQAWRVDPNRLVDAAPTIRRIRALGCIGWSAETLSQRLGKTQSYLSRILIRDRITTATATKIGALFDELRGVPQTGWAAERTARAARRHGGVQPDQWADIEAGVLTVAAIPEKACGCHPYMPNEWTADGYVCIGCGWGGLRRAETYLTADAS